MINESSVIEQFCTLLVMVTVFVLVVLYINGGDEK